MFREKFANFYEFYHEYERIIRMIISRLGTNLRILMNFIMDMNILNNYGMGNCTGAYMPINRLDF